MAFFFINCLLAASMLLLPSAHKLCSSYAISLQQDPEPSGTSIQKQQRVQFERMKRSTGTTLHCKQKSSTVLDDSYLQVRLHRLRVKARNNRQG